MVATPYKKHQNDINNSVQRSHREVKLDAKQLNIFRIGCKKLNIFGFNC
jgi:hypothetical protein